jgi:hypothetical protein
LLREHWPAIRVIFHENLRKRTIKEVKMRNKTILKLLMATALLMLALPVVGSAQIYNRGYERDPYGRYDRGDRDERRDARQAINRLENAGARLQGDLNVTRGRRMLGLFWVGNNNSAAVEQVRNFRMTVRNLQVASSRGRNLRDSEDEARTVINQGLQLDRYLRLRTGSTEVDADLSELRSGLSTLADAYDLSVRY